LGCVSRLPVLYDADCGFCRATLGLLLAWDRRRRLRPIALQDNEGEALLPGLTRDDRLATVRVLPAGEAPLAGGAAVARLLRELPGGVAAALALERSPRLAEHGYRVVACNRSRLSPLIPGGLVRRADVLIRDRSASGLDGRTARRR